jgi:hypothetical protein
VNPPKLRRARFSWMPLATGWGQGDQMSLWKNHPKWSPSHFGRNAYIKLNGGKSCQKEGLFCNLKITCPKKTIAQWAKNSPNLVTLVEGHRCRFYLHELGPTGENSP